MCRHDDYGRSTHDTLRTFACGVDTPVRMGALTVRFEGIPVLPSDPVCAECKAAHITALLRRPISIRE